MVCNVIRYKVGIEKGSEVEVRAAEKLKVIDVIANVLSSALLLLQLHRYRQ